MGVLRQFLELKLAEVAVEIEELSHDIAVEQQTRKQNPTVKDLMGESVLLPEHELRMSALTMKMVLLKGLDG